MKIALLTDGIFPYVIGGMQKHSYLLAKYLAKNQVFVDLYHTNQSSLDISKLELFSEDEKRFIRSVVVPFSSLGKMPGHYIRESFEYSVDIFREFTKSSEVDFIYAKGFCAWKLLDEKQKGFKCAPVGVNFHGYEMFQRTASLRSRLEQIFLLKKPALFNIKQADYVFSYGGKITELILSLGIDRQRILEIPAGIEERWLVSGAQPVHSPRRFLFIGRYERRKGIEELTAAINRIPPADLFEFQFVGPVPDDKKITSTKIKYHGVVTDESRIRSIIQDNDILVCPSYSEGMPNVILEAMACGLAVIATDVGAVGLMVNSKNGWLIDDPTVSNLFGVLKKALSISPGDLLFMKKNSLNAVKEHFIWDNIVSATIKTISGLK